MKIDDLPYRLGSKIALQDDGCWRWIGSLAANGYGRMGVTHTKSAYAHRLVYEAAVGPIPQGLEIDHLCRRPYCVRPDHLEAVTHRENIIRGFAARSASRTATGIISGVES